MLHKGLIRDIPELLSPLLRHLSTFLKDFVGCGGWIRTIDLKVMSLPRYLCATPQNQIVSTMRSGIQEELLPLPESLLVVSGECAESPFWLGRVVKQVYGNAGDI